MNYVASGEEEAGLIEDKKIGKSSQITIMKSNTLLTIATMYFMSILEKQDLSVMRDLLKVWTTPLAQDLINVAFAEEIKAAESSVTDAIEQMEKEANGDAPAE
jgi:hypothetical protein